jgi:bifunctional UDP-N-acetylglucosamine pyrophosphorylase/glucosamine-1-phosphate N-acetyltransferase
VALTAFPDDDLDDGDIVVLPGDAPLVRPATLGNLVVEHREADAAATVLTARLDDPTGYGRVVRDKHGGVRRLVEEADATKADREIDEVGTSIYCFRRSLLAPALRRLSPENAAGEYYLTDVIDVLAQAGHKVIAVEAADPRETVGVNDRLQLAGAEAELRRRINERWMKAGVTMLEPDNTLIDWAVRLSTDVALYPGTILQGRTFVGAHARLGPNVRLVDCAVGEGARVQETVARDAEIGPGARVGPYALLRPGSHIADGATTGPFYTGTSGEDESPGLSGRGREL